ncbi:ATP-dependent helicase [Haploplasma axanthum]|uniref:DNA 3'-5' helicase n=1 Tax=Haploplasma axanthum TaxID=29552 RepID=A0A449BB97_HAPAX|nr:ATP-dependent helicase [Haploplasma axanthum]VEU79589.1 ATP-dependent DNA helicase UvrD/PcrA [Haploplasma axanthum]
MRKYSDEQLAAINSKSKHTAVIAGAGSGKTTVLIQRIKKLLDDNVISSEILAITFTKKAAIEMRERLKNNDVLIKTFDSFCYQLLNDKTIKFVEDNINFSSKEILSFSLYDINLKQGLKPKRYDDYEKYKNENSILDFNDLEYKALEIIKNKKITYNYILIDEFQDTNSLQYQIFISLINKNTQTFVVGDPDQSIYGFRGADFTIINKFIKKYDSSVIILKNNYRSTNEIVKSANSLIDFNVNRISKKLSVIKKEVGMIKYYGFNNDIEEYRFIINMYLSIKVEYQTFAILFRNHEQGFLYKKYFYNNHEVSVLSIHESKGLEFDVVFLIGLNKNTFPSIINNQNLEIEEERRLMFVAVTRAKTRLYLTSSNKKSKFIKELKI